MGRRLAGPFVGAAAAVLLATSPTFLFEITAPASDVAATFWWSLALFALMFDSRSAAFGAGAATGMAILTRPNVAPLALVLAAPAIVRIIRASSTEDRRHALRAPAVVRRGIAAGVRVHRAAQSRAVRLAAVVGLRFAR